MPPADLALLGLSGAAPDRRLAGRRPVPDHPAIAWATAVAQTTLAAFVARAIVALAGTLAEVPLAARLVGLVVGVMICLTDRRRLLPGLMAGLAAMLVVRSVM
ncbi:AzlD domain-containing protein [Roseomonas terrae]|uniref:AzlD domain-containing protein n=1 Tax=Neoroseomonas terrae TaxID=424799 RepID=A0ABS5EDK0_9PROT|nr:hypothetical protein [Neoroseomonas terrae]MBR0649095.1 AzlD domain-containing protein [Neoroseomonas terrae]